MKKSILLSLISLFACISCNNDEEFESVNSYSEPRMVTVCLRQKQKVVLRSMPQIGKR